MKGFRGELYSQGLVFRCVTLEVQLEAQALVVQSLGATRSPPLFRREPGGSFWPCAEGRNLNMEF